LFLSSVSTLLHGLPPLHPAKGYALDPFLTVHSTVNVGIAKGEALNCGVWGRTGPIVSPY